jgi:hypothetical protein
VPVDKQVVGSTEVAGGGNVVAVIFIDRTSQGSVLADVMVVLKFPIADKDMP